MKKKRNKRQHKNRNNKKARKPEMDVRGNMEEPKQATVFDANEMAEAIVSQIAFLELTLNEAELTLNSSRQLGLGKDVVEPISRVRTYLERLVEPMELHKTHWPDRQATLEVAQGQVQDMLKGHVDEEIGVINIALKEMLHSQATYEQSLRLVLDNMENQMEWLKLWSITMWGVRWKLEGSVERLIESMNKMPDVPPVLSGKVVYLDHRRRRKP